MATPGRPKGPDKVSINTTVLEPLYDKMQDDLIKIKPFEQGQLIDCALEYFFELTAEQRKARYIKYIFG